MSSERKYKKAPISEAVCEIKTIPTVPWDMAVPGLLYEQFKRNFPKRRQVTSIEAALLGGTVRTVESERLQFLREDEKALISVAKDTLSVSRLGAYPGWEVFRPEILENFKIYAGITKPSGFQRLGLRYVNQINFKEERVALEGFFEFYPFLGKSLPQDHGPFIAGVQLDFDDARDSLRVQLATGEAPSGSKLAVVLDLDYFLSKPAAIDLERLEEWLETAHMRLGGIFEGCLKDTLRTRFESTEPD